MSTSNSDAVAQQPTLEQQMAEFKGFSTEDGTIARAEPAEKAPVEAQEADSVPERPRTASERLAALSEAPKAGAVVPPKRAVEPEDGTDEADSEAPEGDSGAEEPKAPAKDEDKKASSAQERINKAIGKQRAAERALAASERRYADLEARMRRIEGGGLPPQQRERNVQPEPDQDTPPDPQDYKFGDLDGKYISDLARYETRKEIREEQARRAQAQEHERRSEAREIAQSKFRNFETEGLARYPDFYEVVTETAKNKEWPLSDFLGALIVDSEHGPDIAYHLARNPEEAKEVYNMPPAKQARWFGRREAVLSSEAQDAGGKPAMKVSRAPDAPSHRVRGSGDKAPVAADTQDFAAFERMATTKR